DVSEVPFVSRRVRPRAVLPWTPSCRPPLTRAWPGSFLAGSHKRRRDLRIAVAYTCATPPSSRRKDGAWSSPLLLDASARSHLADAEDDEFRGLHRREADLDGQLAGVDDLGRVGLLVALDVEGLLRRDAHERPVAPQEREERRDRALDALPQPVVV